VKVRCVTKSAKDLPKDIRLERIWGNSENIADRSFALTVGKEYIVYGVTITLGHVWYYICDEDFVYYPVWNPASLFEITDSSLPQSWRVRFDKEQDGHEERFLLSFPEWVNDKYFYDKLTDGNAAEVEIFNRYKKTLDNEA
jgi:hypothetical protein